MLALARTGTGSNNFVGLFNQSEGDDVETDKVTETPGGQSNTPGSGKRSPRRSQQARRSETINKLTDAAIAVLVELGYAKASTYEICHQAGVSQGALFRYFATRGNFMSHVASELLARQVEHFESSYFNDRTLPGDPVERGVLFTRIVCHTDWAKAWIELVVASRTDEQLHDKVAEVFQKGRRWTRQAALRVFPEMVHDLDAFNTLVDSVLWIFEMEGIFAHLDPDEDEAGRRLQFAVQCYRQFFRDQEAKLATL